ncbi:MAG: tetratricopeptide repeat protein, partial [Saprospiraceae bacterium]|nr:tetratricopeptide repeat protein [Saprospiraceae bacterium]
KADLSSKKSTKRDRGKAFADDPKLPKIKGDPDGYFLKHKPAIQDARLWLAKTLIERDRYGEAENIMRTLDSDARTFDEIRDELYVVQAYSSLDRGQIAASVEPLRKAIDQTKRGESKSRYAFILAQVLEQTKQYDQALAAYDQVVKLRPAYEMHLNALLNKTKMQWNTASIDDKKFGNIIERMIKDDKNVDYQDQLYFALAEKDLKNGDFTSAIANLSKSVSTSSGNQVQKADSYYKMANLFFQAEEFARAKYYFDSTLMVLQPADERHEEVSTYVKNLSQIALHLETIELQDSLLKVGQLSDKELKKLASKLKKDAELARLAAQTASSKPDNSRTATLNQVTRAGSLASAGSAFFAYDDKALKKGIRDFRREWGDIGLEDNWRRSNRNSFDLTSNDETEGTEDNVIAPISETEIDEIFKDVPKTDAEIKAAQGKIEEALFELGRLFRSELGKNEKSIDALERMMKVNPKSEHLLDAYYLLYVSHSELGQNTEANVYKDKIMSEYPDSEYAKYINDPSYLRDVVTEEVKVEQYYQEVHRLYTKGQYKDAYSKLKEAPKAIGTKHLLLSKFSLISAMCIGRLQGREQYVNALKELIAKYPNTEEEEKAKEIIRLLGIRFTETNEGIEEIDPDAYFQLGPSDNMHLILVALKEDSDGAKQNQARIQISDYNKKYHKLDRLNVATIVLNGDRSIPLFVIRRFSKRDVAMKYYDGVQSNLKDFIEDPTSYEVFATSQRNYRKIIQLKSIDLYRDFFVKEYLSK